MRVCFVYPDIGGVEYYGTRKYYHGLGYISAVLKQAGHTTTLIYLEREPSREQFLQDVAGRHPDLVAFSSTTHQHFIVERCARWIKEEWPHVFILSGGTHPTLAPEQVAGCEAIDAICVGEGEEATLELVERLERGESITDIRNLWVRQRDEWIRNPLRPLIADLDALPFADRELFDFGDILARNKGWVDMMAGRGCPYNCSYCCNPGLKQRFRGLGRYVRFRGVDNLMAEIEQLAKRYPVRMLNFQDDTFALDREWTLAFCEAYAKRFTFPFWINTRMERIKDEEMVAALARARCHGIRVGIESGNERLRKEILKRGMTNEEIRHVFRLVRRYGLKIYACNMLGLPGETPEMIDETIQLNRELAPDDLQFSIFYPYPMTELYDRVMEQGLWRSDRRVISYYERESVLDLPTITPAQLAEKYDEFAALKRELRTRHRRRGVSRVSTWLLSPFRWARNILRRLSHLVKQGLLACLIIIVTIFHYEEALEPLWTFLRTMINTGFGLATPAM